MNITLSPELFQTEQFQSSLKEKIKSAYKYDYNITTPFTKEEMKHYNYGRAVKGVLCDFAFMGYLMQQNIDHVYSSKKRKYHADVDFILLPSKQRIDVKSSFNYWKKQSLVRQEIDYIVVAQPLIEHKPEVYRRMGYTLVKSYRQLFKSAITVNISGYTVVDDYLKTNDQTLQPIKNLFP